MKVLKTTSQIITVIILAGFFTSSKNMYAQEIVSHDTQNVLSAETTDVFPIDILSTPGEALRAPVTGDIEAGYGIKAQDVPYTAVTEAFPAEIFNTPPEERLNAPVASRI